MRYFVFGIASLFIVCANAQQTQNRFAFNEDPGVVVLKNNQVIKNPWAGGINFGQVSTMDLNNDGREDLVVFDKVGSRVTTYIDTKTSGNPDFKYAPEYRKYFPKAVEWMLLRDYNCDGKKDVFIGDNGGIRVYTNTTIGSVLSFTKAHTEDKLQVTVSSGDINLHVPKTDIPGIIDVDNDGDLDILTFSGSASYIEFMENKQNCGLNFVSKERCWGHFQESATNNTVLLDQCSPFKKKNKTMHAGGSLLPLDLNGDGVKELLMGDVSYDNIVALFNDGTADSAHMFAQDTLFPNYDQPINMNRFPAAFYEDVTGDSEKDLIVSPNQVSFSAAENYNSMQLYKNNGTTPNPSFQWVQNNFLQEDQIDLGEGCVPRLVDLNGDGLQDLILANSTYFDAGGTIQSTFTYYENIGSQNGAVFSLADSNMANIGSFNLGLMPIPTFGDLDNDGDLDMIVGDQNGQLHYFVNTGSVNSPSFSLSVPGINGIDVGNSAAPYLSDIDSNGTLDLLIGNENGRVHYYSNSSPSSPSFSLESKFFGGIDVRTLYTEGFSVPYVFENNGTLNVMVGSGSGVYQYDSINKVVNLPSIINGTIGADTLLSSNFNESPVGFSKLVGRNQILVTAAELQAEGLSYGYINTISLFGTTSGHSIIQKGINVYMKNTNATDLSSFESDMTMVSEDLRILMGQGWNPILIEKPFLWDGVSNLVIQICFSANSFTQSDPVVRMSNTSFTSHAWGDVGNNNTLSANGCSIPLLSSSTKRPNLRFNITPAFVNTDVFLKDGYRNSAAFHDLDSDGFIDAILGNYSGGAVFLKGKIYDVSIEEPRSAARNILNVYPNPGSSLFRVVTKNMGNNAQLSVFDLTGRLILSKKVEEELTEVKLESQPEGIYMFILTDGNTVYSQKVVKE